MKKRALISVYDKDGILEFAQFLVSKDIEIVSTGGTYRFLKENNIPVLEVSEITQFPEMLDGRVKTLHATIHAGILAIRGNPEHMDKINEHNIKLIDFVIVNLYPFFKKVKENITFEQKIEFIDIGGPAMLRAAAKNFHDVVVICDKNDYKIVQQKIAQNSLDVNFQRQLAAKVFNLISAYDGAISQFMSTDEYPEFYSPSFQKKQLLRYGENPHQSASFYGSTLVDGAMNTFEILNGKELSYNNFKDVDIAWKAVCDFDEPACCALKHNTPCGFAIGKDSMDAYTKAHDVDPKSIFGGIISFNRKVTKSVADKMVEIFLEVIAAPEYDEDALCVLKTKKNLRVIKFRRKPQDVYAMVSVDGGLLVQAEDRKFMDQLQVVTKLSPTKAQIDDLLFAMRVVKYVKSNGIVVARDGIAVGISGGQVNRI
jgi:phosphoribosylaminoimidazolecarboxamide formyltransferase/IMP cyclohydrolase